jgi:valyl-tRNA synthetase
LKVETKARVPIIVVAHDQGARSVIDVNFGAIARLANAERIDFVDTLRADSVAVRHTARFDVQVVYEKKIDVAAECERLKKELEKIEKETANLQRQLGNEQFLAKAPAEVIDKMRARVSELEILRGKTQGQLTEMGA